MEWTDILKEARDAIKKSVPNAEITLIDFEGPIIVIYTKDIELFTENPEKIKDLVRILKRRVAIRQDPKTLMNEDKAKKEIEEIVPDDAGIKNIYFEHDTGEVIIEAEAPGIIIGKNGNLLNDIKKTIKWAPKIVRAPPIYSKTVLEMREFLKLMKEDRKEFLRDVGKKLNRPTVDGENWVRFVSLGGYREVGRSATLLMTRNSKVLIDCGLDVSASNSNEKWSGAPYLYLPEIWPVSTLDAVVLTHAHLDHSGLIPLLYKYGFEGAVYSTAPTRDLAALLLLDYIKVSYSDCKKSAFESKDIKEMLKKTIPLKYGETTDITQDMRLTLHNAGHILGSSIAHFHIGDGLYNIAITGDIKFERSWLFNAAMNRFPRIEAVIMESTYGGKDDYQPPRKEANERIKDIINRTHKKGGKVIIPVFAVGRSQEVMLVLQNYMISNQIPKMKIYLDGMIWEATAIHAAYPEFLNRDLRESIFHQQNNPFLSDVFVRVDSVDNREKIINSPDPCIVLATSGMMNGGPVMEYFKHLADDPKHTLVFVGYQAVGTFGRKIQNNAEEITLPNRGEFLTLKVNIDVETVDGFSGHSDRRQLMQYIASMQPRPNKIFTCHGEETKCIELASGLYRRYGMETYAPRNLEASRLK